uniref:Uncharacterized protein n=1 Tax=Arundo donax TaxID=35708 RepID=A0A0A9FGD5_ARUDO
MAPAEGALREQQQQQGGRELCMPAGRGGEVADEPVAAGPSG